MTPLVSILVPAYNAGPRIADMLRPALAQTWSRKEIIIVDDRATHDTVAIARQFECAELKVASKSNEGAAATRNLLLVLSQSDFIQWLDADGLPSPGKVERQLRAPPDRSERRVILCCPWVYFSYRSQSARFAPTSLWADLSPMDWMVRKLSEKPHQQTATWLTSRKLVEAAGPRDRRTLSDDDGEYFSRVLMASKGTRFLPEAVAYYRIILSSRLSDIGGSDRKMDAAMTSMQMHVGYLQGIEGNSRIRAALLSYIQTWAQAFHPGRRDIFAEIESMAPVPHARFAPPQLRWKYRWLRPLIGHARAWRLQLALPYYKARAQATVNEWRHRFAPGSQVPPPLFAVDG